MTNLDFLRKLFPQVPLNRIWVGWSDGRGFPGGPADEYLARMPPRVGHYFCIGSLKPGHRQRHRSDIEAIWAFVLDDVGTKCPIEKVPEIMATLGPPTWIVESSKGNFQYGWSYAKGVGPIDWPRHKAAVEAFVTLWGVDQAGANPNHVFRLPSGINLKEGKANFATRLVTAVDETIRMRVEDVVMVAEVDWSAIADGDEIGRGAISGATLSDRDDPWVDAILETGIALYENPNGTIEIICPWAGDHTDDRGGTAYLGEGKFKCHHAHCAARGSESFKLWLDHQRGFDLALLVDMTSRADQQVEDEYAARMTRTTGGAVNPDRLSAQDLARLVVMNRQFAKVTWFDGVFDEAGCKDKQTPFAIRTLREWTTEINNSVVVIPGKGKAKSKPVKLGTYWLGWLGRRTCNRVDMVEPGSEPEGTLNVWTGLAVSPRAGAWPLFREYLFEVVAAGDQKMFDFVVRTLQWWLKHPLELGYSHLVLYGMTGAGKTILFRLLEHVFGKRYSLLVDRGERVLSGFNDQLAFRLLVAFDEAVFGKDKRITAIVKAIVDSETLTLEAKFQAAYSSVNRMHVLFFTNDMEGIPIDPRDRRATVLAVGEGHVEDKAFYAALTRAWCEGGEAEAFLAEALLADFTGWSPRQAAMSQVKVEAMIENARPGAVIRWWANKLSSRNLPVATAGSVFFDAPKTDAWDKGAVEAARDQVIEDYKHWVRTEERGAPGVVSAKRFWRELRELCPDLDMESRKISNQRFVGFPTLNDCRTAFEKIIAKGTLIDWDLSQQAANKVAGTATEQKSKFDRKLN